ncbi:hypothetical protein WMY93_005587 [Mugilogobius chulae]|uniref:Uncharacterized protein n=1 Tax=Mugilogobius chulae TaxID=88201 RepID=A0AAW0PR64_9GOBI
MPSFPQKKQPLSPGAEPVCARSAGLVPQPVFSLTSPVHGGPSAVSVLRLPRLIAEVGPRKALQGSKWTQGLSWWRLRWAQSFPLPSHPHSTACPLESELAEQPHEISQSQRSPASCRMYPATVSEVLHLLITGGAQQRPLVFYLREEQGPERRPYDLRVVPPSEAGPEHYVYVCVVSSQTTVRPRVVPPSEADRTTSMWFLLLRPVRSTYVYVVSSQTVRPPCGRSSEAGPEHYIFCRGGVVHVTLSGYGGVVSLAQWYREAVYWDALHNISFFRTFRLRKAFYWWRAVVRRSVFLQRCEKLQKLLLTDCSLYRRAVFALLSVLTRGARGQTLFPSFLFTLWSETRQM